MSRLTQIFANIFGRTTTRNQRHIAFVEDTDWFNVTSSADRNEIVVTAEDGEYMLRHGLHTNGSWLCRWSREPMMHMRYLRPVGSGDMAYVSSVLCPRHQQEPSPSRIPEHESYHRNFGLISVG